jgi:hypothetical protein
MKEWALDDEKNVREKLQASWNKRSIYLVRRKDDGTSTVETIPRELLRYKSEYHYLFTTLLKFQTATRTAHTRGSCNDNPLLLMSEWKRSVVYEE